MGAPYLEWWTAGLALGGLAVAQWLIERRTVGVSGLLQRSMTAFVRPEMSRQETLVLRASPEQLRAALLSATADEFGADEEPMPPPVRSEALPKRQAPGRVVTTRAALLYIAAIAIGSAIAAMQRGDWSVRTTLGPGFEALWGDGVLAVVALFGGGILVGVGTRMAGGCTSGHGLSGCSRFQPGSLVSTATFMAAAVAMTFALRGLA